MSPRGLGLGLALLLAGCAGAGPTLGLKSYVGLSRAAIHYLDSTERATCKAGPPSAVCQEGRDLREALRPVDAAILDGFEKKGAPGGLDQAIELFMKILLMAGKAALLP